MNLLQPQLLWLLAAVAVPVVVHLYNRRRAVVRPFPAIDFLLRSQKLLARRLKLRQLLLLALRIGVFLLLPLAIAKPYLLSSSGITADEKLPSAVVYVIDDSASMRARAASGGTLFEVARDRARDHLDSLRSWDEAALLFASELDAPELAEFTPDFAAVRDALDSHEPTFARVDLRQALVVARDLAMSSELPVRKVVLVTDLARGSWPEPLGSADGANGADVQDLMQGAATVELIDVGGDPDNLALVDAGVRADRSGIAQAYELWGTVRAFGPDAAREATVDLLVDGELVASSEIELTPGQDTEVLFNHRLDSELLVEATLRLQQGGALDADDTRHVVLTGTRAIRVLLVNGDPRSIPYQDELFYLERALRPAEASQSSLVPRITPPEALDAAAIAEADVIVLANVGSLKPEQLGELERFVRGGGGLLIAVGDRVDPQAVNRDFGDLLPMPLRNRKLLAQPGDPDAAIKVTRLDKLDFTHAVLRPFALPGGEGLQSALVYSYMLVEPEARDGVRIVAAYADGGPALLERSLGAGRVLLLTTTLDRDWSDLAINKSFLPLCRRISSYLARSGSDAGTAHATVGEWRTLALEGFEPERIVVTEPGGGRQVLGARELLPDAPARVRVPRPGVYRVTVTEGNVELDSQALAFAANLDAREADTSDVSPEALAALWAAPPQAADEAGHGAAGERRVELWPPLLLLTLLLLYLETLVGLRRSFLLRLRRLFGRPGRADASA